MKFSKRRSIIDIVAKVELIPFTNQDERRWPFFEMSRDSKWDWREIREGFDLYRRRGIQIAEIYARTWRKFAVGEFLGISGLKNMAEIWRRQDAADR